MRATVCDTRTGWPTNHPRGGSEAGPGAPTSPRQHLEPRRRSLHMIATATLVIGALVGSLLGGSTTAVAQTAPIINEDVVPGCIPTAGDPYPMTRDVCLAWGRLQQEAVNRVIASSGLASDRTLALTRARSSVRAMLWAMVEAAAAKPVATRTADETTALTWLAAVVQQHNISVATRALGMFDAFYREQRPGPGSVPCTFTPPSPYQAEYPGKDKGRESFCFAGAFPQVFGIGVTNKPKSEEWLRWANADVMGAKFTAASGAIARDTAGQFGLLGASLFAGAVAVGIPILIAAEVITISANVAANIAIVAEGTGAALVGGAAPLLLAALGIFVAVLGVYAIIAGSIAVFDNQRPGLEAALADAQKQSDIGDTLAKPETASLAFTLFAGWLSRQTEPVGAAPAPPRVATDPRFTDLSGSGFSTKVVDSFTVRDEAGVTRTATMHGGYWIVTGPGATTVVSPDLSGVVDSAGKPAVVRRVRLADGSFVFVTARTDGSSACGTTPCPASREFKVRGNGTLRTIRYVGTQDGKDNPPLVFDFDKVTTAQIGTPAPFYAFVKDSSGKPVSATISWEIGDRCLIPGVLICPRDLASTPPAPAPDGSPTKNLGTTADLRYSFASSGTWWMRAKATTNVGTVASKWFSVEVANPAPVLAITSPTGEPQCSTSPTTACPATNVGAGGLTLQGTITDKALKYEVESVTIDWGDGLVESAPSAGNPVLCARPDGGGTVYERCVQFGALTGDSVPFSATRRFAPSVFGARTAKVTVRDLGGNQVSLAVPYNIADPRQTQTVQVGSITATTWGTTIDLAATASSGLPIIWSASPANWCVVDGAKLYTARAGRCTVAATQVGDATYKPTTGVQQVTVTARPATISFRQIPDTALTAGPATTVAVTVGASDAAGAAPPSSVTLTSRTPGVCSVTGATVTLVREGSCTLVAAISAGETNWTASPVEQTFTVLPRQPTS